MVIWGFTMLHITPRTTVQSLCRVALCWLALMSGAPAKAQLPESGPVPILEHPALKGRLIHPTRIEDLLYYDLSCEGTHRTTGQAIWRTDQQSIRGILHVKLGGKNMTFYQRVTAVYQGVCKD
jgi:hypothetical protein